MAHELQLLIAAWDNYKRVKLLIDGNYQPTGTEMQVDELLQELIPT